MKSGRSLRDLDLGDLEPSAQAALLRHTLLDEAPEPPRRITDQPLFWLAIAGWLVAVILVFLFVVNAGT